MTKERYTKSEAKTEILEAKVIHHNFGSPTASGNNGCDGRCGGCIGYNAGKIIKSIVLRLV